MEDLSDLYVKGMPGFIDPLANTDVQINLDDESNRKLLEDPGLVKHMEVARIQLSTLSKKPVDHGDFDTQDTAIRQSLSSIMLESQGVCMALKLASGDADLEHSNSLKLCRGEVPHGYTAAGQTPSAGQLQTMAGRLDKICKKLDIVVESADKLATLLTRTRRAYEDLSRFVQNNPNN